MNMTLQDRDRNNKLLDNSKEIENNLLPDKKETTPPEIIYWVNAPKIDSKLWINT